MAHERTKRTWIAGAVIGILLIAVIPGLVAALPLKFEELPPGFLPGTLVINGSAIFFLLWVSWLRRRPLLANATEPERAVYNERENRQTSRFTAGLFVIAVVFAFATWINAVAVGRSLGSMVVAYFALGAILAWSTLSSSRSLGRRRAEVVRQQGEAPRRRRLRGRLHDRPRGDQCVAASVPPGAPL